MYQGENSLGPRYVFGRVAPGMPNRAPHRQPRGEQESQQWCHDGVIFCDINRNLIKQSFPLP